LVGRSLAEWVGRNANTKIPDRVHDRVELRAGGKCQICGARVISGAETDHIIAVKNWNPTPEAPHGNRESNLQFACGPCHTKKTGDDVAEKAKIYKTRKHHSPRRQEQTYWAKQYAIDKARALERGWNPWGKK
jgi:5-methylcytosine-specific restriction protein A